jgi:hypothetical protein
MELDNFTKRYQRLLKTVLQPRYETTPKQMRHILAKMRELLLGHPKVTPEPARVRFVGYGTYSKDAEIFAYLDCHGRVTTPVSTSSRRPPKSDFLSTMGREVRLRNDATIENVLLWLDSP